MSHVVLEAYTWNTLKYSTMLIMIEKKNNRTKKEHMEQTHTHTHLTHFWYLQIYNE